MKKVYNNWGEYIEESIKGILAPLISKINWFNTSALIKNENLNKGFKIIHGNDYSVKGMANKIMFVMQNRVKEKDFSILDLIDKTERQNRVTRIIFNTKQGIRILNAEQFLVSVKTYNPFWSNEFVYTDYMQECKINLQTILN